MGLQPRLDFIANHHPLVRTDVCHRLYPRRLDSVENVQARGRAQQLGGFDFRDCGDLHHRGRTPRTRVLLRLGLLLAAPFRDTQSLGRRTCKPRRGYRHPYRNLPLLLFRHQALAAVDSRPSCGACGSRWRTYPSGQSFQLRDFRTCHHASVGILFCRLSGMAEHVCRIRLQGGLPPYADL